MPDLGVRRLLILVRYFNPHFSAQVLLGLLVPVEPCVELLLSLLEGLAVEILVLFINTQFFLRLIQVVLVVGGVLRIHEVHGLLEVLILMDVSFEFVVGVF